MEPKTSHLNIRVTEAEHRAVASRTRKSGLTLSAYVRRCTHKGGAAAMPAVDADELRRAYANLKRAGSNINQCAHALNTYGREGCSEERAISAMQHVSAAADAVADALAIIRNGEAVA